MTSAPKNVTPFFHVRFTMVFSELPDMSDNSHEFLQQYQKEKEQVNTLSLQSLSHFTNGGCCQEGRNGHGGRNGNNHSTSGGESLGQKSGRSGLGQHGDGGRRSYTSSPTGNYRPSPPPHTYTSSHPHPPQQAPAITTTSHVHPTNSHSLLQPPVVGGPHGENYHSQNLVPPSGGGPHRLHSELGSTRYQPYSIRR